jgi:3-dehydroquinate dehydratase/shikimate dehydrogenase
MDFIAILDRIYPKEFILTMEFIVIAGPTFATAFPRIKRALKLKDGIELRIDLFTELSDEQLLEIVTTCKMANKKIIFTLRSQKSGGGYKKSIPSLEEEILKLSTFNPDYMDVEWDLSKNLFTCLKDKKIIASHHDFEKTQNNLETLFEKMFEKKTYGYKICTTAIDTSDAYRMLYFIHKQKQAGVNFIGLCMGEAGKITREEGLKAGNYLNYKIMHLEDKVASGLDFA